MRKRRQPPDDHDAYAGLPVRRVTVGDARAFVAVHATGKFTDARLPVVCLAGYHRNMADHAAFAALLPKTVGRDWPLVLVDLQGRGRASDRASAAAYSSVADARDLGTVMDALGIERAVFLGQGHGGQVLMALGAHRPALIAGTVLIDAGPIIDTRSLVRLRSNLRFLAEARGAAHVTGAFRRMLAADQPGATEAQLDALARRTHFIDRRGRARPLFDPALVDRLDAFDPDDVLEAQWGLFEALAPMPMLLLRTQFTDQLHRATFEAMARMREDAVALVIPGQGSPALLAGEDEVGAIAEFVAHVDGRTWRPSRPARKTAESA